MKAWATWAVGGALVAGAWAIAAVTPADDAQWAPFEIAASVGERAEGRDIAATVDGFRLTSTATAGGWSAEGNWLIVDLTVSSVVTTTGAALTNVTLDADGTVYSASTRPPSLYRHGLRAGIPESGSVAFELPADFAPDHAQLRIGSSTEERLDSVVVLDVPIVSLPRTAQEELQPTQWSTP